MNFSFTLSQLQITQFSEEALNLSSTEGFGYFPGFSRSKVEQRSDEIDPGRRHG